jgi:hypothetical protein
MADKSAPPLGRVPTLPVSGPDVLALAIKEFAMTHDGASAVVELTGRRGARILLTGSDGSSADAYAPGTDVARDACQQAGVDVVNTWERDLFDEIRAQATT